MEANLIEVFQGKLVLSLAKMLHPSREFAFPGHVAVGDEGKGS
jgi:hypothetical protein